MHLTLKRLRKRFGRWKRVFFLRFLFKGFALNQGILSDLSMYFFMFSHSSYQTEELDYCWIHCWKGLELGRFVQIPFGVGCISISYKDRWSVALLSK